MEKIVGSRALLVQSRDRQFQNRLVRPRFQSVEIGSCKIGARFQSENRSIPKDRCPISIRELIHSELITPMN